MYTGAEALLDGANRPLNFADVTVGRDDVHVNRPYIFADAFKLIVCMNVAHV